MSGEQSVMPAPIRSRAVKRDVSSRTRLSVVGPGEPGLGPDAVALPTEEVLVARIALPLASHRQRQAAAGFAVEDLIAEPLEASHVVLGPQVGTGEYLVFVVRHEVMAQWAAAANRRRGRLVPDVLGLPIPAGGSCSVREALGRVMVRRADGTGYAAPLATFEALWQADGAPQIVLFGGRLPDGVPVVATGLMPATPTPEALAVDLLQGPYLRDNDARKRLAARLTVIGAVALLAHGAILAADTFALQGIARDREAALRSELSARVPGLPDGVSLDLAMRRAMPAAADQPGSFIPLLSQVSEALQPSASDVAVQSLAFSAADGTLAVSVEAPDLGTLQRVETDLGNAGLKVSSGVATTGDGGAEVRYVIGPGQ